MAIVITVFSGNGGAGKSVFASSLACGLKSNGKNVLLSELSFGTGSDDCILGIVPETRFNIADVCFSLCEISDAITKPDNPKLPDFISSSPVSAQKGAEPTLKKLKSKYSNYYDYIVIDLALAFGEIADAAFEVSDVMLALTDGSFLSVRNTAHSLNHAREKSQCMAYTVLNRCMPKGTDDDFCIEDVIDEVSAPLIGIVPYDECVNESVKRQSPIFFYNTYAGRSIENICKRLMGENIPSFEKGNTGSLFSRNKLSLKTD